MIERARYLIVAGFLINPFNGVLILLYRNPSRHFCEIGIFAAVLQRLKFILLLLTSFCYFASIFEWDSNECKQNYAKEDHSYVACVKTVENSDTHIGTPIELPTFFVNIEPSYFVSPKPVLFTFVCDYDPPDKIYLLHSSLLI